jgi:hypothetical protein
MFALLNPIDACGVISAFAPPVSAESHSPFHIAWQAREIATSDDEQAVSTARLGPLKSNKYETRFAAMLRVPPLLV